MTGNKIVNFEDYWDTYGEENHTNVRMGGHQLVDDKATTISTDALASCIGVGIVAKDEHKRINRFLTHISKGPSGGAQKLSWFHKLFPSDEALEYLRIVIASTSSFKDITQLDQYDQWILNKLKEISKTYAGANPDFFIEFLPSSGLKIDPSGNISAINKRKSLAIASEWSCNDVLLNKTQSELPIIEIDPLSL